MNFKIGDTVKLYNESKCYPQKTGIIFHKNLMNFSKEHKLKNKIETYSFWIIDFKGKITNLQLKENKVFDSNLFSSSRYLLCEKQIFKNKNNNYINIDKLKNEHIYSSLLESLRNNLKK